MPDAFGNEKKYGVAEVNGQMIQAQPIHSNVWDRLVGMTTLRVEDAGTKI